MIQVNSMIDRFDIVRKHISHSLYRNSVYLMASTFTLSVFGFFFWILVSRLYTTQQIGIATTIISICALIMNFSILGLRTSIIRYLPNSKSKSEKISTSFNLITIASIIASVIFIIGIPFFSPILVFIRNNYFYSALFIISIIFSTLSLMMDSIFTAYRAAGYVLFKNIVWCSFKLILPFILLYLGSYGIFLSFSLSNVISVVLCFFILIYKFGYKYRPYIDITIVRLIAKLSFANYVSGFISMLPSLLLPVIITNNLGPKDSAYFYIDMMIANLLYIIPIASTQSLFAEASYDSKLLLQHLKKTILLIGALMFVAIIVTILWGNIILLSFGKSYSDSGFHLLQLFAIAGVFVSINSIGATILNIKRKINLLIGTSLFFAILTITLSIFLTHYGLIGIGFSWLIGEAILAVINYKIIQKLIFS